MRAYFGARVRGGAVACSTGGRCAVECGPACGHVARDSSAPRARSGLAYAAGFAGLAVLFRPSFATLFLWDLGFNGAAGASLFILTGLVSPAALALSFYAAADLDRAPGRRGRAQVMLGFFAGWAGSVDWLAEVRSWLTFLGF